MWQQDLVSITTVCSKTKQKKKRKKKDLFLAFSILAESSVLFDFVNLLEGSRQLMISQQKEEKRKMCVWGGAGEECNGR